MNPIEQKHNPYCHFFEHSLNHADMDVSKCSNQPCSCPPTPVEGKSWKDEDHLHIMKPDGMHSIHIPPTPDVGEEEKLFNIARDTCGREPTATEEEFYSALHALLSQREARVRGETIAEVLSEIEKRAEIHDASPSEEIGQELWLHMKVETLRALQSLSPNQK